MNGKGTVSDNASALSDNRLDGIDPYSRFTVIDGIVYDELGNVNRRRCTYCYRLNRPCCFFDNDFRKKIPKIELPKISVTYRMEVR